MAENPHLDMKAFTAKPSSRPKHVAQRQKNKRTWLYNMSQTCFSPVVVSNTI